MAKIINVIKGTKDILPQDVGEWHRLEETALKVLKNKLYKLFNIIQRKKIRSY